MKAQIFPRALPRKSGILCAVRGLEDQCTRAFLLLAWGQSRVESWPTLTVSVPGFKAHRTQAFTTGTDLLRLQVRAERFHALNWRQR